MIAIDYILASVVCYLGLIGGFIVRYFAKEELKNIHLIWIIQKSSVIYAFLAVLLYSYLENRYFEIIAAIIFIYGIAVGSLNKENYSKTLFDNSTFLITGALILLVKILTKSL